MDPNNPNQHNHIDPQNLLQVCKSPPETEEPVSPQYLQSKQLQQQKQQSNYQQQSKNNTDKFQKFHQNFQSPLLQNTAYEIENNQTLQQQNPSQQQQILNIKTQQFTGQQFQFQIAQQNQQQNQHQNQKQQQKQQQYSYTLNQEPPENLKSLKQRKQSDFIATLESEQSPTSQQNQNNSLQKPSKQHFNSHRKLLKQSQDALEDQMQDLKHKSLQYQINNPLKQMYQTQFPYNNNHINKNKNNFSDFQQQQSIQSTKNLQQQQQQQKQIQQQQQQHQSPVQLEIQSRSFIKSNGFNFPVSKEHLKQINSSIFQNSIIQTQFQQIQQQSESKKKNKKKRDSNLSIRQLSQSNMNNSMSNHINTQTDEYLDDLPFLPDFPQQTPYDLQQYNTALQIRKLDIYSQYPIKPNPSNQQLQNTQLLQQNTENNPQSPQTSHPQFQTQPDNININLNQKNNQYSKQYSLSDRNIITKLTNNLKTQELQNFLKAVPLNSNNNTTQSFFSNNHRKQFKPNTNNIEKNFNKTHAQFNQKNRQRSEKHQNKNTINLSPLKGVHMDSNTQTSRSQPQFNLFKTHASFHNIQPNNPIINKQQNSNNNNNIKINIEQQQHQQIRQQSLSQQQEKNNLTNFQSKYKSSSKLPDDIEELQEFRHEFQSIQYENENNNLKIDENLQNYKSQQYQYPQNQRTQSFQQPKQKPMELLKLLINQKKNNTQRDILSHNDINFQQLQENNNGLQLNNNNSYKQFLLDCKKQRYSTKTPKNIYAYTSRNEDDQYQNNQNNLLNKSNSINLTENLQQLSHQQNSDKKTLKNSQTFKRKFNIKQIPQKTPQQNLNNHNQPKQQQQQKQISFNKQFSRVKQLRALIQPQIEEKQSLLPSKNNPKQQQKLQQQNQQ